MKKHELKEVCRVIAYGLLDKKSRTEIAEELNALGIMPPKAGVWTEKGVSNYRYEYGLPTKRFKRDWRIERGLPISVPESSGINPISVIEQQLPLTPVIEQKKEELPKTQELLSNNNAQNKEIDELLSIVERIVQLKNVTKARKQIAINALTSPISA